jgi:hypothetical protein
MTAPSLAILARLQFAIKIILSTIHASLITMQYQEVNLRRNKHVQFQVAVSTLCRRPRIELNRQGHLIV